MILLDVVVSNVSCLDLIPLLGNEAKIIVITELLKRDTAVSALRLGAFDILEKPFNIEILYYWLLRALTVLKNERKALRLRENLDRNLSDLSASRKQLEALSARILKTQGALTLFAENITQEREEIEKGIAMKFENLIKPVVETIRTDRSVEKREASLDMLAMQIADLTSLLANDCSIAMVLSSSEMRVAFLIRNGFKTEQIAKRLNISEDTVRSHRKRIRRKLNIDNRQYSLRNFLTSRLRETSCHAIQELSAG